jgi:hypothetical protein
MKEAGCRLLIVGYESGDPQILKNIKKGATIEMAERFTANCKKLGLLVHGDFIVGLPGETRDSIRRTIDWAKRLDTETIQVSIAHPYPGTEFYDYGQEQPHHHRLDDRRGRPPASQHGLSGPGPRRTGGLGGALLRRVLLPAARGLAHRAQGRCSTERSGAAWPRRPASTSPCARQAQKVRRILLLSGWVLSRMALLSWADLSYVIPVTSIGFVLNAVMGAVFLGETITPLRWTGTLCIVGGTVLVGLTAPRTEGR